MSWSFTVLYATFLIFIFCSDIFLMILLECKPLTFVTNFQSSIDTVSLYFTAMWCTIFTRMYKYEFGTVIVDSTASTLLQCFFFSLKFSTPRYKSLATGCFVLDDTSKLSFNRQEKEQPNYVDRLFLVMWYAYSRSTLTVRQKYHKQGSSA